MNEQPFIIYKKINGFGKLPDTVANDPSAPAQVLPGRMKLRIFFYF
ncbi:hypothetical protein AB434_2519 [Heyndrickxia coagulans]|uniref:Uncharacterized protein n=1 Tax=Heyndrickxia coagulans TaxID=1398 RepID=A0AAN0WCY4_HEYCO|nr:hypothetical protein SB48_HM08orf04438 [Heyndrickxia coagulans]AKN54924.1 hypothetical protein AB434_2519 [Heyndrickxia coagulans]KYC63534.1 hypothetical protein B4100_0185 [Heyndrickxia coagulans]